LWVLVEEAGRTLKALLVGVVVTAKEGSYRSRSPLGHTRLSSALVVLVLGKIRGVKVTVAGVGCPHSLATPRLLAAAALGLEIRTIRKVFTTAQMELKQRQRLLAHQLPMEIMAEPRKAPTALVVTLVARDV
jgi:hypothetical protein